MSNTTPIIGRADMIIETPIEDYEITPGRGMYLLELAGGDVTAVGIIVAACHPKQRRFITDDAREIAPIVGRGGAAIVRRGRGARGVASTAPGGGAGDHRQGDRKRVVQ